MIFLESFSSVDLACERLDLSQFFSKPKSVVPKVRIQGSFLSRKSSVSTIVTSATGAYVNKCETC